jgi:hypothetical protein
MKVGIVSIFLVLFIFLPLGFAQESITISTYYPTPFGSYRQLRTQRQAIGSTYFDPAQYPWDDDGTIIGNEIPQDVDFIAEGDVGIGSYQPNLTGADRELTISSNDQSALALQGAASNQGDLISQISFFNDVDENASIDSHRGRNAASGTLSFYTSDSGTLGERMRISQGRNVGIGTAVLDITSPANNLSSGNLNLNDLYLESISTWASTLSPLNWGDLEVTHVSGSNHYGTPVLYSGDLVVAYGQVDVPSAGMTVSFGDAATTPFSIIEAVIITQAEAGYVYPWDNAAEVQNNYSFFIDHPGGGTVKHNFIAIGLK